jgi:prepilin-type N-terminal cleavage/methylation domain-containing protein
VRRNGFTMIELMIVVVIIGLVSLIAFPRIRSLVNGANRRGARARVVAVYAQARMAAQQANRAAALRVIGNKVYVVRANPARTTGCRCDTVGTVQKLDSLFGVTVTATQDSLHVNAGGIGGGLVGGNPAVITVTLDGSSSDVQISPFGKVK